MRITLKIFRFNPEKDQKPHYEKFTVEADPNDRVLDLLEYIKGYHDGTLSFRRSCAHGICGSDALRINGRNYLACKALAKDFHSDKITVEPILGMKVLKDLIVDMGPFFENYRAIMPYLVNDEPAPKTERLQSPEARERFDDTTKCILCACCTSSCPSFWANDDYLGPAAFVNAHRFIFDDRDRAAPERLKVLSDHFGVYRCHTIFNCTIACPREIEITQAIGEIKKALVTSKLD
jgi:succinate dehydrogenase / fumarate reductase iron-sulfur subunit